jgi:hypothetical protein
MAALQCCVCSPRRYKLEPWTVAKRIIEPPVLCPIGEPDTDALQRTTTAITMIHGGIKENVMPSIAQVVRSLGKTRGS